MTFPKNFIKATKDFSTPQKPIAAPLFRKVFTVDKAAEAQIIIAACGFYKLFINVANPCQQIFCQHGLFRFKKYYSINLFRF